MLHHFNHKLLLSSSEEFITIQKHYLFHNMFWR